ncbi:MAG: mechanosensitive ion channel family protein [Micrococcales bacterium]
MHTVTAVASDWFSTFWNQWHVLIRIVLIVIGSLLVRWSLKLVVRRVVSSVEAGARVKLKLNPHLGGEISPLANARLVQRTRTMASVLNNFITWTVFTLALTMVLSELGVAIGALAAGAGLVGAGIGFGAQSLIKDLISGLFIVSEDQYGVGDTVNLGEISGTVESVGLRVTQVRDVDGILWYVRNGEILRVGNHSQGWSRAVVDVALDYGVDLERAKAIIDGVAAKVATEPHNTAKVMGEPEVLGVHLLTGDQLVIRVVQKTKFGKSDDLARDLRGELKRALDEAGIAMASSRPTIFVGK